MRSGGRSGEGICPIASKSGYASRVYGPPPATAMRANDAGVTSAMSTWPRPTARRLSTWPRPFQIPMRVNGPER
ncbi:MAG: hypothetical protein Q7S41_00830 [Candidatus Limnocylindria bacterium]|nr:hypothetical protein [Candidatus Limnocylindria bacterium]